jgi:hypothetical protein
MSRRLELSCVGLLVSLCAAFAAPAHADPYTSPSSTRDAETNQRSGSRASRIDHESESGIDLRIRLRLPSFREAQPSSLLGQVALSRTIPGAVITRYRGLHGFVVKRLRRRYQKYWRSQLRELERGTNVTTATLRRHRERLGDAIADMRTGGRWWERSWFHSLPEDQGGAPSMALEHEVGSKTVFSWGPLQVSNEMRARILRVGVFRLDPEAGPVFRELPEDLAVRDHARLLRVGGEHGPADPSDDLDRDVGGEIEDVSEATGPLDPVSAELDIPQHSTWSPGSKWSQVRVDFKIRPEVRLKLKSGFRLDTRLGVRCRFEIRFGPREEHLIDIQVRARFRPRTQEGVVSFQVALIAW